MVPRKKIVVPSFKVAGILVYIFLLSWGQHILLLLVNTKIDVNKFFVVQYKYLFTLWAKPDMHKNKINAQVKCICATASNLYYWQPNSILTWLQKFSFYIFPDSSVLFQKYMRYLDISQLKKYVLRHLYSALHSKEERIRRVLYMYVVFFFLLGWWYIQ